MEKIKTLLEKLKAKRAKKIIALVCVASIVLFLAAMPLLAKQDAEEDGPKASILSGNVTAGSINTEILGGGTLAEEDAVTVSVPSAVKLKEFLVSNGDTVTEGMAIATVDRVTVMTAISQVQETLEYLAEQIQDAGNTSSQETVTALAGGTVKILYAQKGDSVQSVMLEHGALAVLSLDGLMAVDLETESTLPAGSAVTLQFESGKTATGKVAKNLAGEMTVTVEDKNYAVDAAVEITDADGNLVGAGQLYIYSPWNATAYAGTVSVVKVSQGSTLSAGKPLFVLSDVGYSATYQQLIVQRQKYEDLMFQLFRMYQTETLVTPCDGVVSGIDKDSVQLLSDNGQGYTLSFLANAPNGDDETLYVNYVTKVLAVAKNGWALKVNPQAVPIADYLDLTGVSLDETLMTEAVVHTKEEVPVFTRTEETWTQVERSTLSVGDIILFAADEQGNLVWGVLLQKATENPGGNQPETPEGTEPGGSTEPGGNQPETPEGTEPGGSTEPGGNQPETPEGTEPGGSTEPGGNQPETPEGTEPGGSTEPGTNPSNPGGSNPSGGTGSFPSGGTGSFPSGGMSGGFPSGGVTEEQKFELYGLNMTQVAAITPQTTITLDITVDEMDVTSLQVGMTAQIKIDALGGEKHTATITEIANTGENNGGSSKYTVELTMERSGNMLSGMNASATVVLSTVSNVLTVPVDALVEQGNQTFVYTGYDEKNETLFGAVAVKVGVCDGETVEILEGLSAGQTYYYAYYDTLEISYTPDFGGVGGFMFG